MFWRFGGYSNISTLDSVLDKPDVTLEELLDESDLIQELKSQNAKLIEFLRDDTVLEKLLKYVLSEKKIEIAVEGKTEEDDPKSSSGFFKNRAIRNRSRGMSESDEDKQETKRAKYAYVSCEILSSEVYSIYESLLALPEALREFWSIIRRPAPLDAVQASYFTKINEAVLEKKPGEMVEFIKTIDNVVADMMKHVDCPVIMDLLLKLISLEKEPEGQGVVDWLQTQGLMPMLLSYITPAYFAATQTSAGDFLKAVITISANAQGQDASVIGPNELTRQLVSETCVSSLISEMLKGGNPLTVGVGIIIEVIRKNNSDYDTEGVGPDPKSSDPIYLGTLLRLFSDHITDFMNLILSPKHTVATENGSVSVDRKDLKVAWGDRIEPLGFDRFKTCELMAELLHCSNMGLLNERGSEEMVKARDVERDRLKAEGKLATVSTRPPQADFGSVDSSEFHHAEAFTPLGESPENVKRLEVQNNNEDDEEFEKVAISDALNSDHSSRDDPAKDENERSDQLSGQLAGLELDESPEASAATTSNHPPRTSSKPPVSLLTQQLKSGQEETSLSYDAGLHPNEHPEEAPAPLFADRKKSDDQQTEPVANDDGEPGDAETMQDDPVDPQQLPIIETEEDGSPVVGDLLKMKFVDNHVVPTIVDFFFRFPWNNFLHNVVYDVVQQVFNGSMDRGFNRNLAIDLFETGRIIDRVIEGQERSDQMQNERKMRLGYMGHLTLIAEEIVKFTERQPAELLAPIVVSQVTGPGWIHYVEHTLEETRQKDNAVLGGIRPDVAGGPRQAVLNTINNGQAGIGNAGSAALANAGLGGGNGQGLDGMDLSNASNTSQYTLSTGSLLSGFGSSDDEDEDDLEETDSAEVGGSNSEHGHQGRIEDEEQTHPSSSNQTRASDSSDQSSNSANVPAPLSIPPSRARRQLAARLAERKRSPDSEGSSGVGNLFAAIATSTAAAAAPASSLLTRSLASGRADNDEVEYASDEAERGHSSGDDLFSSSDEDEDEDEPSTRRPVRQTTREATPAERRPLDSSSSSSSSEEDEETADEPPPTSPLRRTHASSGNLQTAHLPPEEQRRIAQQEELARLRKERQQHKRGSDSPDVEDLMPEEDLDIEDYWRLGELREAAAQRAKIVARTRGSSGSLAGQMGVMSNTTASSRRRKQQVRKREQDQLLLGEDMAERTSTDSDDDEDEDEDGVSMGSKYLKRGSASDK